MLFSRASLLRILILLAIVSVPPIGLAGCSLFSSELNNRGGFVDAKLDARWIIADTKQMRVLRAYILIGSIARMSRETYYKSERETLIQKINSAVNVAKDAFTCAYAKPGHCVYFDERMAEFEVALLRIAIAVLHKHENETLLAGLTKELSDTFPLLKAADTFSKLIDAFDSSVQLASHAAKIVKSLIEIGEVAYFQGRRLGALYRDSIELDMVVVLASLRYQCQWQTNPDGLGTRSSTRRAAELFYGEPQGGLDPCRTYDRGFALWKRGAGDLALWKSYLSSDAAAFRASIIPDQNAFIQASDLIWRACEQITDDPELLARCLGRRLKHDECGCKTEGKKENCDVLMYVRLPASEQSKVRTEAKREQAAVPQCPLIAFYETWDQRKDRFANSSARLDYLSELNPSFLERAP